MPTLNAADPAHQFQALERASMTALHSSYFRALSAQLQGGDAGEEWDSFSRTLSRSLILAHLIGRWKVMRRIGLRPAPESPLIPAHTSHYADSQDIVTAPFINAINVFMGRIPMLRRVVDALAPVARARAFWITGIESTKTLARIQHRLTQPLQGATPAPGTEGGLRGFIADEQAITGLTHAHLENVYRTNVMAALNQGGLEQMQAPELRNVIALTMLEEIHDRRTRGAPGTENPGFHWQMDGFVERPDHPIWQKITPPCGFQCRGHLSTLTWPRAEAMGFAKDGKLLQGEIDAANQTKWALINAGRYPDPGFTGGA